MDKPFSAVGQAYPVPAILLLAQDGEGLPEGKTGQQLARGGSAHPDPIPCGVAGTLCNSRRFLQFDIIRAGVSVAAARQPDTVPAVYFAYHLHPLILDIVAYDLALQGGAPPDPQGSGGDPAVPHSAVGLGFGQPARQAAQDAVGGLMQGPGPQAFQVVGVDKFGFGL